MTNKKFEYVEPEIIDYHTEDLDNIEGNVSDYTYEDKQLPAAPQKRNLVLPTQAVDRSAGVAGALGHLMAPNRSSGIEDAHAIQHMQAMSEKSSPRERSAARLILWAGWGAVATVIAVALYMMGLRGDLVWGTFIAVVGYGVIKTTSDENKHSPAGVERHKSEVYRDVRLAQIQADDRASARNHATFNRVVDQVYGGGDRVQNRITHKR